MRKVKTILISWHVSIVYRWMVSDRDSKAFTAVEDTYEDCNVVKLDCVGHAKTYRKTTPELKSKNKG